jgi:hypothetical protein
LNSSASTVHKHSLNDTTTSLLEHAIDLVLIIKLQHLWSGILINAFSIQQETQGSRLNALALCVGLKDLGHFGRLFDLEKGLFARLQKRKSDREVSEWKRKVHGARTYQ